MNETLKKGITIFLVIVIVAFIGLSIKQYLCMNKTNPFTAVRLSDPGTTMNPGPVYIEEPKNCKFFSL